MSILNRTAEVVRVEQDRDGWTVTLEELDAVGVRLLEPALRGDPDVPCPFHLGQRFVFLLEGPLP